MMKRKLIFAKNEPHPALNEAGTKEEEFSK
jgi:hypothetical protein